MVGTKSCHAKIARQMTKGTYMKSEMPAITRRRNRHDRAPTCTPIASAFLPKNLSKQARTKLDLRVVQRHRLLRISLPHEPRLRHASHSTKQPEREEHESEVEEPTVHRRALLRRAEA